MKSETLKHNNVEEYYSSMPTQAKIKLYEMREIIKSVVPGAEEVISYGIPAFKQNGILVYFAGYKNHIGFYPTSSAIKTFKNEFADYKWSKGAVQFPIDKPLPKMLIKRMVKFRAKEDKEKTKLKKVTRNNKNSKAENYVKYHNDGSIWAKGKVINNVPEGYWEWFRKGGTIMRSGYFSKGKQVGEWTTYDNKGKVHKVTVMKDGK